MLPILLNSLTKNWGFKQILQKNYLPVHPVIHDPFLHTILTSINSSLNILHFIQYGEHWLPLILGVSCKLGGPPPNMRGRFQLFFRFCMQKPSSKLKFCFQNKNQKSEFQESTHKLSYKTVSEFIQIPDLTYPSYEGDPPKIRGRLYP